MSRIFIQLIITNHTASALSAFDPLTSSISSLTHTHTLARTLTHWCWRNSAAKWYTSFIHVRGRQQLHYLSGCWQSGPCLFVLAAPEQVHYVLGRKKGSEAARQREFKLALAADKKKRRKKKKKVVGQGKTLIPMVPCFWRGSRGLASECVRVHRNSQDVMYGVWKLPAKAAGLRTAMGSST